MQRRPFPDKSTPHQPLDTVSLHRVEDFAGNCKHNPRHGFAIRGDEVHAPDHAGFGPPTPRIHEVCSPVPAQRLPQLQLTFVADGEFVAALRPAPRKNLPPGLRRHPLTETMRVASLPFVRLKCPLHLVVLPKSVPVLSAGEKKRVAPRRTILTSAVIACRYPNIRKPARTNNTPGSARSHFTCVTLQDVVYSQYAEAPAELLIICVFLAGARSSVFPAEVLRLQPFPWGAHIPSIRL